jgi:hypothetical protein
MKNFYAVCLLAFLTVTSLALAVFVSQPAIQEAVKNPANETQNAVTARFISGTEYKSGEQGQGIVQLLDYQNQPVTAQCNLTVYYPDKSAWIDAVGMLPSTENGTYYFLFTLPAIEGIYEEHAVCNASNILYRTSSTFHVSPSLNTIMEINSTLNAMNISVESKLQTLIDDLSAHNLTIMTYLNATNQSYTTFLQNLANNQTFWFPAISNNQTYWFPALNDSIESLHDALLSYNITANFSDINQYLNWIWHGIQNLSNCTHCPDYSIYWTTNVTSTFKQTERIIWDTLVVNATGKPFDNATCRLEAYLPNSTLWLNVSEVRVDTGWFRYTNNLPKITGAYNWNVTCIRTI